jgi:hypothetical protein
MDKMLVTDEPESEIIIIKQEPLDDESMMMNYEDINVSAAGQHNTKKRSTRQMTNKKVDKIIHSEEENDDDDDYTLSSSRLKCGLCSKKFKKVHFLEIHMENVHAKRGPGSTIPCKICAKPISLHDNNQQYRHLRTHMNLEELQKENVTHYICYFCDDIFLQRPRLEQHFYKHTKVSQCNTLQISNKSSVTKRLSAFF